MNSNNRPIDPLDAEIERDVAELRRLLDGVEGPREPHPAYYQNFVVRLHDRIDHDRNRRRFWHRVGRFASLGGAAAVLVVVATTVFKSGGDLPIVGNHPQGATPVTSPSPDSHINAGADPLFVDDAPSIVLNKNDVRMLNAIMSEDDNELFMAMANPDELQP